MPSLDASSLVFSLLTQPVLLFWFWAVDTGRVKHFLEKWCQFKPAEWFTQDETKRADYEWLNLEVYDGDLYVTRFRRTDVPRRDHVLPS